MLAVEIVSEFFNKIPSPKNEILAQNKYIIFLNRLDRSTKDKFVLKFASEVGGVIANTFLEFSDDSEAMKNLKNSKSLAIMVYNRAYFILSGYSFTISQIIDLYAALLDSKDLVDKDFVELIKTSVEICLSGESPELQEKVDVFIQENLG